MPPWRFADEVEITVRAGHGGAGCVSFERRRFKPRGAPDGGDGGSGGDVVLAVSAGRRTLRAFRYRRHFQAAAGRAGQGQRQQGRQGADLVIEVPPGTLVFDAASGHLLQDLATPGARLTVAHGGRGGKGNAHFTSSRQRSPRFAQPGEPGQERRLRLELQLLAEVGLLGWPNAGKTTLLTSLTAAKARVAPYPFTTLDPNLGVLQDDEHEPLIIADIPGLITGAHQGRGLGDRFLRHLQRTQLLLHLVDASQIDERHPEAQVEQLEAELRAYDPHLLDKPRILILNKIDLLPEDFPLTAVLDTLRQQGYRGLALSALTGEGLEELKAALWQEFESRNYEPEQTQSDTTSDSNPGQTAGH
ncbi:MAG: GTPase ObgE [Desulfobacca sp.]|nr:GTPase ObgE [Desulfobacca sp.]